MNSQQTFIVKFIAYLKYIILRKLVEVVKIKSNKHIIVVLKIGHLLFVYDYY